MALNIGNGPIHDRIADDAAACRAAVFQQLHQHGVDHGRALCLVDAFLRLQAGKHLADGFMQQIWIRQMQQITAAALNFFVDHLALCPCEVNESERAFTLGCIEMRCITIQQKDLPCPRHAVVLSCLPYQRACQHHNQKKTGELIALHTVGWLAVKISNADRIVKDFLATSWLGNKMVHRG